MTGRRRLLFSLVTAAAVLGVAEAAARVVFLARGDVPPTADESLEHEWKGARKHLAAGKALLESDLEHDPALGWRLKPGIRTERLKTNSAGMRGEREFAPEPGPGERRIVLVGDSYTFGQGNADEETFAAYLQAALGERTSVLNLGV